jgi:hypothetical protein
MSRLLITSLCIAAQGAGCAATPADRHALSDIVVLARGQDAGGGFCADFSLTSRQAQAFLGRSAVVTPMTSHDEFDILPCWVKGTAKSSAGLWHWEVRAGGTGKLESPDGDVELLGCKTCDDLLGGTTERK